MWTQQMAIDFCRKVEDICPKFGCHVALTGGTLYKDGERKDIDVLFYRIRQVGAIDKKGLLKALRKRMGCTPTSSHGWVEKALWEGESVDFFFPDHIDQAGDGTGVYA